MIIKNLATVIVLLILCTAIQAEVIYVDDSASGQSNGSSWQDAHLTISSAIRVANLGDEIWTAEGTYAPITLKNGVKLLGGFTGGETSASRADPEVNKTYISGQGTSQVVKSINNDANTVLRGFVIKDGHSLDWKHAGGGLYLENSSAMIVQCVFTNNSVRFAGGAVANYFGGEPTFVNCRFYGNGGMNGNITPVGGGAVFNHDGSPSFVNCLFYNNKAADGGAIATLRGTPSFINCTFADNEATNRRGGALYDNLGKAVVRNCILWNNAAFITGTKEIYNNQAIGTTDVEYSDVHGAWLGTGNVDADPLFVNAATGDYRLQAGSPSRDRGNNAALPADSADLSGNGNRLETLPLDLALRNRIEGSAVDMGAFEIPSGGS